MMTPGLNARAESEECCEHGDEERNVGTAHEAENLVDQGSGGGEGVGPTAEKDERDGQENGGGSAKGRRRVGESARATHCGRHDRGGFASVSC